MHRIDVEQTILADHGEMPSRRMAQLGPVWALTALFTCFLTALNGVLLWLPQIVKGFSALSSVQVGFLSTLPFLCGGVAMLLWARYADHVQLQRLQDIAWDPLRFPRWVKRLGPRSA